VKPFLTSDFAKFAFFMILIGIEVTLLAAMVQP
jgi:hypothetical protein